jgi:hypothetical protein
MSIYALRVNDETIKLTFDQLNSDPGNAFAKYFSGRSNGSWMEIESEPGLFKLIQAHLRGYDIFPIPDGSVPYMNREQVLKNLLKEAETYELHGLVAKIRKAQNVQVDPTLPSQWKIVVSIIVLSMREGN